MATTEARPEAKPEPKEIEENFATAVAWESGKPLVMERVKVAPPKAMEMRATKGARIFGARLSIGVESVDLKPKRFDKVYNVRAAKEKTETSTSAEAPDKTNCI
ncbi:hypothetical protein TB2_012885 [Malus domestica]